MLTKYALFYEHTSIYMPDCVWTNLWICEANTNVFITLWTPENRPGCVSWKK